MNCPKCGASMNDTAKFCRICGTSLAAANAPVSRPVSVNQQSQGQHGQTPQAQHGQTPQVQYRQPPQVQYRQTPQGQYGQQPPQQNSPYSKAPTPNPYRSPSSQPATTGTTSHNVNMQQILLIVVGVLVLVAAVIIIILLLNNGEKGDSSETETSAASSSETAMIVMTAPTSTTEPVTAEPPSVQESTIAPTQPQTEINVYNGPNYINDYIDFPIPSSGYVIPDSSSRKISESELYVMTEHECCIARNEIYARHGRIFRDAKISEYFEAMFWYHGTIDPGVFDANTNYYLNSTETANIATIRAYERRMFGE